VTPVVAVAGVIVTVAWFGWQCRRAVKVAARPSPHGGLSGAAGGRVDGSSLPVPTPGELRTPKRAPDVCRLADITYRQLDHWIAKGIVGLSDGASRRGQGPPYRTFTDKDVEIIVRIAGEKRDLDDRIAHWMKDNFLHLTDDRRS
jgi:hypothetical protein